MKQPDTSSSDFVQALLDTVPQYDALILKDIKPKWGWLNPEPWLDHLPEDSRFLPNRLIKVYLFHCSHPKMTDWQIAGRLRLKKKTVESRLELAFNIVDDELKAWLKTLPKNERRCEVYKRHKTWRQNRFPRFVADDRFKDVFPDTPRSEWPPIHKPNNCTGEPCDSWAPMRHWDD